MVSSIKARDDLSLELIHDLHAEALFDLVNGSRHHLREWLPWIDKMQALRDFQGYINRCRLQHEDGSDHGYVIKWEGKTVGRIGIHYLDRQNKSGAIGYWLGKEFSGKGIITASCSALIHSCFETLALNRIEIRCATGNHRSAAVAERLHFKKEAVLRQAEYLNGRFVDLNLYSLLKEEWYRRQQHAI